MGGPNSGGGRRNKEIAKTAGSARSRFSTWRPPSSNSHGGRGGRGNVPIFKKVTQTSVAEAKAAGFEEFGADYWGTAGASTSVIQSTYSNVPRCVDIRTIDTLSLHPVVLGKIEELLRVAEKSKDGQEGTQEGVKLSTSSSTLTKELPASNVPSSSNSTLPSSMSSPPTSLSIGGKKSAEKKLISSYQRYQFTPLEISNVYKHLSSSANSLLDDDDIIWICLLKKVNHLQLPKPATSLSSSSMEFMDTLEVLTYNTTLNEEIETLKSIYGDDEFNVEKLILFDKGCCKLEFCFNGPIKKMIIYIYDATNYPQPSSGFRIYGWILTPDFPNCRDICSSAMTRINEKTKSGDPVVFEFLQSVMGMVDGSEKIDSHPSSSSSTPAAINERPTSTKRSNEVDPSCKASFERMKTLDYRTAYSRALNEGLVEQLARDRARELLAGTWSTEEIDELRREQERSEAILDRQFNLNQLTTGDELAALKDFMEMSQLPKANAKGYFAEAKRKLVLTERIYARDNKMMKKAWVKEAMTIYISAREKKEKKKITKKDNATNSFSDSSEVDAKPLKVLHNGITNDKEDKEAKRQKGFTLEQCVSAIRERTKEEGALDAPFPSSGGKKETYSVKNRNKKCRDANGNLHPDEIKSREIESQRLYNELQQKRSENKKYNDILRKRMSLPAYAMRDEVVNCIHQNRVVVISGDTGCGKSTQIPQLVLDSAVEMMQGANCNILVTQPRRISAISVSERISEERAESLGGTVGYHIRLESKRSKRTRILLLTTGVLLRMLMLDDALLDVSHIFVDEVHERDINTDFLLIILKQLLEKRLDLKVILMSATLKADLFASYFAEFGCQLMNIPGRAFPVTSYYLEDAMQLLRDKINLPYTQKSPYVYTGSGNSCESDKKQRSEHVKNIHAQLQDKVHKDVLRSLELVDETVLNTDLITELVKMILTGNESLAGANSKGYRPKPPVSKADKVEAALRNELGHPPIPPTDAISITPEASMSSTSQKVFKDSSGINDGAILIFVDGFQAILDLMDAFTADPILGDKKMAWILPLHSSLSSHEQSRVFRVPPKGVRKIVISTNIAETSITIEDVVYVIDTCRVKENRYDESAQISTLVDTYCSQANARQRRGRAGRVRSGFCYHLVSSVTFTSMLAEYTEPEMLRLSLEEIILQIMALGLGDPYQFLSLAISPPETHSVRNALMFLDELSAVYIHDDDDDDVDKSQSPAKQNCEEKILRSQITPLGFHLAALPINPRIGKLILFAVIMGCVEPILTIAAMVSAKNPFVSSFEDREAVDIAKLNFLRADSDLFAMLDAFDGWMMAHATGGFRKANEFCHQNYLSIHILQQIEQTRGQFLDLLKSIGFIDGRIELTSLKSTDHICNRNGDNESMIKSVLCAGLSSNLLMLPAGSRDSKSNKLGGKTLGELSLKSKRGAVCVHPSSVMFQATKLDSSYLVYVDAMKTSKIYTRDVTTVTPAMLCLFGSRLKLYAKEGVIVVNGFIGYKASVEVCKCIEEARNAIEDAFIERVLDPLAKGSALWERALLMVEYICNDGPSDAEVRMKKTMNDLFKTGIRDCDSKMKGYTPYHNYPIHPTRQHSNYDNVHGKISESNSMKPHHRSSSKSGDGAEDAHNKANIPGLLFLPGKKKKDYK